MGRRNGITFTLLRTAATYFSRAKASIRVGRSDGVRSGACEGAVPVGTSPVTIVSVRQVQMPLMATQNESIRRTGAPWICSSGQPNGDQILHKGAKNYRGWSLRSSCAGDHVLSSQNEWRIARCAFRRKPLRPVEEGQMELISSLSTPRHTPYTSTVLHKLRQHQNSFHSHKNSV